MEIEIETVPQTQWLEALCLLCCDAPESECAAQALGLYQSAQRGDIDLNGLYGAKRDATLVGVSWGQVLPGKTGVVWPPRMLSGQPREIATQLMQSVDRHLNEAKVQMSQALLLSPIDPDADLFRQCGYFHTAELLYLVCPTTNLTAVPCKPELVFEPFDRGQRHRLARLIEATYIDTQDIPALNGLREMEDVLNGYEQTGDSATQRWLFVQASGRDVGCLLLADHRTQNQFELVYMGLIPAARGRGWGVHLANHAQGITQSAGRERLVLAVDAQNDPAIRAYTKAGFFEWFRRSVFLKALTYLPQP